MKRLTPVTALTAVVLVSLAVVAGCASTGPASVSTTSAESLEPTATLMATHGDEFVSASYEPGTVSQDALIVTLRTSQPAGNRPFADLALLAALNPGRARYRVKYDTPDGEVTYVWLSQGGQVQIFRPTQRRENMPSAYTPSAVHTDTLRAIAAGKQPPPAFAPTR